MSPACSVGWLSRIDFRVGPVASNVGKMPQASKLGMASLEAPCRQGRNPVSPWRPDASPLYPQG
jgi:hypothetical protein